MTQFYTYLDISLGEVLLFSDGQALTGCYIKGQQYQPGLSADCQLHTQLPLFQRVETQLQEYLQGIRQNFTVPYHFATGTLFQQQVWHAITTVAYGTTLSYRELAKRLAMPTSFRAVAAAVGRNPLLIIVPCQRIIGSNGSLTGYAAGLALKSRLLDLEQRRRPGLIR
ncbi:MAG: methylated-DNA/protein-cysteine methyltransferase [Gammaproteobacteria bacterium]|nr:methylated-DNA/protein-cysteine methyltransferase [Gammaproteobacteria bacterium]